MSTDKPRSADEKAITKQLKNGRTAVITAQVSVGGVVCARATVDGKEIGNGWPGRIAPIDGSPELTHGLGRLALTTEEFHQVQALIRTGQTAYEATPEGRRVALHRQRRNLVDELSAITETAAEAKADAFDEAELDGYFRDQHDKDESRISQARRALREFDRGHPEIKAELDAERRARADAAMWD